MVSVLFEFENQHVILLSTVKDLAWQISNLTLQ